MNRRLSGCVILLDMDAQRARELLSRERARIERALADAVPSDPDDYPDRADPGDVASATLENELEAGLAERLRGELEAIERAEQRLAQGRYGLSVESGQPIPDERLEAIPWAERTTEEQARYDELAH